MPQYKARIEPGKDSSVHAVEVYFAAGGIVQAVRYVEHVICELSLGSDDIPCLVCIRTTTTTPSTSPPSTPDNPPEPYHEPFPNHSRRRC